MKKILFLITSIALTFIYTSCSNKYIDATYNYNTRIGEHTYAFELTLDKEGNAHLQMKDKPIIERLSDYELSTLYFDGYNGHYEYNRDCDCYQIFLYTEKDYLYSLEAYKYVTNICIGDDGYMYFSTKSYYWANDEYEYTHATQDAKNHTNRGPKYSVSINN